MSDIHIVYRKIVDDEAMGATLGEPQVLLVTDDEALARELLRVQEVSGRVNTSIRRYINTFRLNEMQVSR